MEMRAKGESIPNPIISFGYLNFEGPIMNLIVKQGFQKPTPIQCQVIYIIKIIQIFMFVNY